MSLHITSPRSCDRCRVCIAQNDYRLADMCRAIDWEPLLQRSLSPNVVLCLACALCPSSLTSCERGRWQRSPGVAASHRTVSEKRNELLVQSVDGSECHRTAFGSQGVSTSSQAVAEVNLTTTLLGQSHLAASRSGLQRIAIPHTCCREIC